jgi:hypothetical protein
LSGTTPVAFDTNSSTGLTGNVGLEYTSSIGSNSVLSYGIDYTIGSGKDTAVSFDGVASSTAKMKYTQKQRLYIAPGALFDDNKLGYFKLGYGFSDINFSDTGSDIKTNNKFISYGFGMKIMKDSGYYYFGELNLISGQSKSNTEPKHGSTWDSKGSGYNMLFGVGKLF